MDSFYYDDDRESSGSPLQLSPLTPDFDEFMFSGADQSSYFGEHSNQYQPPPLFTNVYSNGAETRLDQQDSGFWLDHLPSGTTMPKPYPGNFDPSIARPSPRFTTNGSSQALHSDLHITGREPPAQQYTRSTLDNPGFLPSPLHSEASVCSYVARDGAASCGKGNKMKRKNSALQANVKRDGEKTENHPSAQLRTATRAMKRCKPATNRRAPESQENANNKSAHNLVEKQYRMRLNQQFELLLASLPRTTCDNDGMEDGDLEAGSADGSMEKRISKAEVLDLARRRIKSLEKEKASLEKQKRDLMTSAAKLQDGWRRNLGETCPVKIETTDDGGIDAKLGY